MNNQNKNMYKVRKLKLGISTILDKLCLASGELYSRALVSHWRIFRKKGLWLKASSMMRWHNSKELHAHSADAVVQTFYASLKSWKRRKNDATAKPPRRLRKFFKVQWKSSAIRIKDGLLILSNGKGNELLEISWKWGLPKLVEIGWNGEEYELRATYIVEAIASPLGDKIAGVDLGEVHMAVAYDGETTVILNGRGLRSFRRYQNKLKGVLYSLIAAKQRGSRRYKRLLKTKLKQLKKLKCQILDVLHKQTRKLISTLYEKGVKLLVIGDIRDIRHDLDYGRRANQKIHQMVSGVVRHMLTYKAELLGMEIALQEESYTSQTCPHCKNRHKPSGRNYKCKCGFMFHRDGVGAINIREKYLGSGQVVGAMASPIGLRYKPHIRCSSAAFS